MDNFNDNLFDTIDQRLDEIGHSWYWLRKKIAARSADDLETFDGIGTVDERQISYGLALDLSAILGASPAFWYSVQAAYDFLMDTTAGHYDPERDDADDE